MFRRYSLLTHHCVYPVAVCQDGLDMMIIRIISCGVSIICYIMINTLVAKSVFHIFRSNMCITHIYLFLRIHCSICQSIFQLLIADRIIRIKLLDVTMCLQFD